MSGRSDHRKLHPYWKPTYVEWRSPFLVPSVRGYQLISHRLQRPLKDAREVQFGD